MKPLVLCILDGWGEALPSQSNAITLAPTPHLTAMRQTYPMTLLEASGPAVGLPEGQMGNSEVGHMTLGLGRILDQDLPRIDKSIASGEVWQNKTFQDFTQQVLWGPRKVCHVMGLLSPGGVHSHQNHLISVVRQWAQAGITVYIHAFLDGRDTPPRSAKTYMEAFLKEIQDLPSVHLATISGRYYAMDRDQRWDRVAKAYEAIIQAKGTCYDDPLVAIEKSYDLKVGDEFVVPTVWSGYEGMQAGDAVFMGNFRADRVRQLLKSFLMEAFSAFDRGPRIALGPVMGMTHYDDLFKGLLTTLFPPLDAPLPLGEALSQAGLTQLRLAETEKYAHVTFFFNGGLEPPFEGEDRILIPSPAVATYDETPAMSAVAVTQALIDAVRSQRHHVIIVNYANTDMVGHTGDLKATQEAIKVVDQCLGKVLKEVLALEGTLLITADHGNAEQMIDPETGQPHTAHTTNPVPFVACGKDLEGKSLRQDGGLQDVAPTMLHLMGLPVPAVMTGRPLLEG
jgi:2,3-bisphosphoglycerate-independent phosphoglycerate mutase